MREGKRVRQKPQLRLGDQQSAYLLWSKARMYSQRKGLHRGTFSSASLPSMLKQVKVVQTAEHLREALVIRDFNQFRVIFCSWTKRNGSTLAWRLLDDYVLYLRGAKIVGLNEEDCTEASRDLVEQILNAAVDAYNRIHNPQGIAEKNFTLPRNTPGD